MHDFFNFILGELRGAWRFRWYALGVAWLVALAGAFVVLTMPDQYRVEARVQVNTESMLQPLLQDLAIEPNLQARLDLMTATLLNRENVERIANENDLLLSARTRGDEVQTIESLRRNISIDQTERERVYRISYQSKSPETAQGVVQSVMDLLLEEAMNLTMSDAASATDFLEQQVNDYEERLRQAEQRLAEFKRDNVGMLPDQGGRDYYQRLRATEDEIQELETQKRTAERRVNSIQEQLTALRTGQRQPESGSSPRVQALDEQIRESRQQLDNLLLRYTEEHPDVENLQAQIERLEERREELVAESGGEGAPEPRAVETNPVYQELQIRLNDRQSEVAALESQIEEKEDRREQLIAQVDEITQVETRLTDLTRNYEVVRERYQTLVNRLNTAEMTTEADASGGQMSMRVVDAPITPDNPEGPPRDLYLLALLPVSFGAGGGFAYLLHQIRPVFQGRALLAELTGRPVLGSVSLVLTLRQRKAKLAAITIFGLAALMLVAAGGAGALFADTGAERLQAIMEEMPF
ncbi:hypothetical protein QWY84_06300 [Aquisalimonas lutea]|uniref:XrtA system polysaccharide chain length determinant n=1 Tax=Aquisalimonas lutea TaxID=1327750 RepID=UPI0025B49781|nr:XrtA system polysaccharide chain length determinant [Aquisalimonas lutea]MDN3517211.1 hypothetical protein [Aquisalimonas lutea]